MASLEVYSSTAGRTIGTKAICVRDHINAASFISSITEDKSWLPPGDGIKVLVVQGSILTLQRNEALRQMQGDWVLFIDDDMVYKPEQIRDIVASWTETSERVEEPVIMGGLCHRRTPPFDPTLYMRASPKMGRYRFLEKWEDDIIEVDATGMAFILIPVTALEAIGGVDWPERETRMIYDPPNIFRWQDSLGEDLRFCQDAKAAGCRIFVDTRIEIGHVAEVTIGTRDYLSHVALRRPEDEELARRVNDKYGLPTLTSTEARERLGW